MLINTRFGGHRPKERSIASDIALPPAPPPYVDAGAHWPDTTLSSADGQLCAQLQADRDAQPGVLLAQAPIGEASAEGVGDPGAKEASVDAGHGAYVMSGGWGESAASAEPFLIDERGRGYPLAGPDTAEKLGYEDEDWVLVPDTWVDLFGGGVELSEDAALCPPTSAKGQESCQ